jgi:hypothetical protein
VVRHYIRILRIHVGANGKELVDEVEIAFRCHHVEGKLSQALWWGVEEIAAGHGGLVRVRARGNELVAGALCGCQDGQSRAMQGLRRGQGPRGRVLSAKKWMERRWLRGETRSNETNLARDELKRMAQSGQAAL